MCKGCDLAQSAESIKLPGCWTANHYNGHEGYLGWIALQPRRHVMALTALNRDEQRHLGPNIVKINEALNKYWLATFRDPVKKLYINYFFEEPEDDWHLHMRLIPRFKSLKDERLWAWEVWRATTSATFPEKYRANAKRVKRLMDDLRNSLASGDD